MSDERNIDIAALDNRIRECDLKRWWIAEQIGVDRKTVTRWLTGRTRKIHRDNLVRLATLLECAPDDLVLAPSNSGLADPTEQGLAAELIAKENLLEILTPTGKWPLLEEIIKAAMRPDLPKPLLGQLYNYLCIAAWRRSQLDKAEGYLHQAQTIGRQTKFKAVIARAQLNAATLLSYRGKVKEALAAYHECIRQEVYFDDAMVKASALSNLGSVYHEYGDFGASLLYQDMAIQEFSHLSKPLNLSIALIAKGAVLVDAGKITAASAAITQALLYTEKAQWQRGYADALLVRAWVAVAMGDVPLARESIQIAQELYQHLNIDEARPYITSAMLARCERRFDTAAKLLTTAMEKHPDFPVGQTEILREWVQLAHALADPALVARKTKDLATLYEKCGCEGWLRRLDKVAT